MGNNKLPGKQTEEGKFWGVVRRGGGHVENACIRHEHWVFVSQGYMAEGYMHLTSFHKMSRLEAVSTIYLSASPCPCHSGLPSVSSDFVLCSNYGSGWVCWQCVSCIFRSDDSVGCVAQFLASLFVRTTSMEGTEHVFTIKDTKYIHTYIHIAHIEENRNEKTCLLDSGKVPS